MAYFNISSRILFIYYSLSINSETMFYPEINAKKALRPHVHLDLRPRATPVFYMYSPTIVDGIVTENKYSNFNY